MELHHLTISRNTYGFDHGGIKAGAVGGSIKFGDLGGSTVEVNLSPEHCSAILAIVADSMVETTRSLANNLTREVIQHSGLQLNVDAEAA